MVKATKINNMKLAILLLCHKNSKQINLLLDQLVHPQVSVFVHVDKNAAITPQLKSYQNVFILPDEKRVACRWGSMSLVEATLHLLQYATQHGPFDYFWLCSGQDFPIKPIEQIVSFVEQHAGKEFLDLFPSKNHTGNYSNYDKRTAVYYPLWMLGNKLWQRIVKRGSIELTGGYRYTWMGRRSCKTDLKFYFGSQWWCLSCKACKWILDYISKNSHLLDFYKNTIVPDESLFHTLLMNSPYAQNRQDALHYIDWSEGGNSPKTLGMSDLAALQQSDKFMARKFDLETNGNILSFFCKNGMPRTPKAPARILQIVSSLGQSSGVNAVILNWHHHIDTGKIQFDYLYCTGNSKTTLKNELEHIGAKCYELPSPTRHPFQFLRRSYRFFKEHPYRVVHSHITSLNFFFYPLAKMFGVKYILQHAHGTKWSDKKLNGWRNYLMLHAVWPFITHKLACSQLAGEFWYGKKNFTVINNGVEVEKFAYHPEVRVAKRKELGLENDFVIGNIGRFNLQKNHTFLIDIFEALVRQEPAARLVLAGNGPLEQSIKNKTAGKNLQDKVLFLGVRKDVVQLYQACDVLCMPSLYEGLPVVGVEAQAAGLPCVFADTITPEVLLLPTSSMLSLKDCAAKWAQAILALKDTPRTSGADALRANGFDICQTAAQIQNLYEELGG